MKKLLFLVLLVSVSFSCVYSQSNSDAQGQEIQEVLKEIQLGLSNTQDFLKSEEMLPLSSVELKLETFEKKQKDGSFKILIFTFGKKWEKELAQEIYIKLIPPKPKEIKEVSSNSSLAESLKKMIVAVGKGIKDSSENTTVPLEASEIKVQLKFTIKKEKGAGLEWEILPISSVVKGNTNLSKTAIHTMTITFAKSEEKEKDKE